MCLKTLYNLELINFEACLPTNSVMLASSKAQNYEVELRLSTGLGIQNLRYGSPSFNEISDLSLRNLSHGHNLMIHFPFSGRGTGDPVFVISKRFIESRL